MTALQYRKTITRIVKAIKRVYTGESRDAAATLAVIVGGFIGRDDKPAVPVYLRRRMIRTLAAARATLIAAR